MAEPKVDGRIHATCLKTSDVHHHHLLAHHRLICPLACVVESHISVKDDGGLEGREAEGVQQLVNTGTS
jgi:hypothetical protein